MKPTQHKIQRLTGCSENEYAEVLFNTGISYAITTIQDDALVSALTNTASYWQWYKMQFTIVDEVFYAANALVDNYNTKVRNHLKEEWISQHKQTPISRPTAKVYSDAQKILVRK